MNVHHSNLILINTSLIILLVVLGSITSVAAIVQPPTSPPAQTSPAQQAAPARPPRDVVYVRTASIVNIAPLLLRRNATVAVDLKVELGTRITRRALIEQLR